MEHAMNATYRLDRERGQLFDARDRRFDPQQKLWLDAGSSPVGETIDGRAAVAWLQRESRFSVRAPIGVIGPREANEAQLALAAAVGRGLAEMGLTVICGGRQGIMEATCRGVAEAGGISVGLLPDTDPALANPYVAIAIATGIGEARNALIARAALCLVVIGDSYGTLSEVALGRQFGKRVIGLAGAASVDGVEHVDSAAEALERVATCVLVA